MQIIVRDKISLALSRGKCWGAHVSEFRLTDSTGSDVVAASKVIVCGQKVPKCETSSSISGDDLPSTQDPS